jgi:hypothetical protein
MTNIGQPAISRSPQVLLVWQWVVIIAFLCLRHFLLRLYNTYGAYLFYLEPVTRISFKVSTPFAFVLVAFVVTLLLVIAERFFGDGRRYKHIQTVFIYFWTVLLVILLLAMFLPLFTFRNYAIM